MTTIDEGVSSGCSLPPGRCFRSCCGIYHKEIKDRANKPQTNMWRGERKQFSDLALAETDTRVLVLGGQGQKRYRRKCSKKYMLRKLNFASGPIRNTYYIK